MKKLYSFQIAFGFAIIIEQLWRGNDAWLKFLFIGFAIISINNMILELVSLFKQKGKEVTK